MKYTLHVPDGQFFGTTNSTAYKFEFAELQIIVVHHTEMDRYAGL